SVVATQRERLFTEYLLAGCGGDDHLIDVLGMRRRQQDRVDRAIAEDVVEIVGQVEMMFGAKPSRVVDVGLDGPNYLQASLAARSLGEIAAPAAQTDDCAIDHLGSSIRAFG